ncbi:MAG TPA: J domain-containing protein [Kofleriaceae bacterium]|nr:J domain-containing protein [Kofleriaceae bacterium]
MSATDTHGLRIVARADGSPPGKLQQRFNSLIKKVAQLKGRLQAWAHARPEIHRALGELHRLSGEHRAAVGELIRVLDRMYADRSLTKSERAQVRALLCELAYDVLQGGGSDDLKAIYNKHTRGDFDAEVASHRALHAQVMKSVLEDSLGMDFGDADISSLDELERATMAQLDELEREEAARHQAAQARRARRKKSARQLADEARRTAETAQVGKTLQDVYRKLAMLLHPDHEQDPVERARKTSLMQEVNIAYERKDLLGLLELRLRFERVDEAQRHAVAEDRLAHFNTLLAEQVRQLQQELADIEEPWRLELDPSPRVKLTPDRILAAVRADLRQLATTIGHVQHDRERFTDPRQLKAWLRAARAAARAHDDWPGHR